MSGVILDSSRIRRLVALGGLLGLGLALGLLGALPAAGAEPPAFFNYQGVLRDSSDAPLDGDHDMVFRFWSHETGGDEILVDTHDALGGHPVTVSGGLFNAVLGSGVVSDGSGPGAFVTLKHVFRDYGDVWLEVEVDGEVLTPRVQVLSAGYAINADHLDGLNSTKLLRSDTSDQFTFGTLTIATGTALQVDGDLNMGGAVTKATTDLVTNFNSDLLDGLDSSAFAAASHGHAGSDITGPVGEASNADTLDGFDSSSFLNTSSAAQTKAGPLTADASGLVGAYGVQGHGAEGGGYFIDSDQSGNARVGYNHYGILARGNISGGYFEDLDESGQASVAIGDRGIDAHGSLAGGYFTDSDSSAFTWVATGDRGIEASGSEMGGFFGDSDGSGFAHAGKGDRGIAAMGNEMGGRFRDFDSTGEAYVGYGDRGIEAFGNETGGFFHDLDESGYAYVGYGHYGIEAHGAVAGGYFLETDGTGQAYVADADRGIWGYGTVAGGYFEDSDGSGYAYLGHGHYGISSYGGTAGGYFKDSNASGQAHVGYGSIGVSGQGDAAGGYFEDSNSSGYAYVGYENDGVVAKGTNSGGQFWDLDHSGYAIVGVGDDGIEARGNRAGGAFFDRDQSGEAQVGHGDYGIDARGNWAGGAFFDKDSTGYAYVGVADDGLRAYGQTKGGYFQDTSSSVVSHIAYGSDAISSTGNKNFVQNHPYEDDKVVVYSSLEGDEVGTYTRGTARLVDGAAEVPLGETFRWVTNPDIGLTAHLTARGNGVLLYVESLTTETMVVRAAAGFPGDVAFDYVVLGLRTGFEEVAPVREKDEEAYIPSMNDHREWYERSPDVRRFNALERFKVMTAETYGFDAAVLDLSAADALRAAIQEYDPEVHGPISGRMADPESATRSAIDLAGTEPTPPVESGEGRIGAPATTALIAGPGPLGDAEDRQSETAPDELPDGATLFPVSEAVKPGDLLALDPDRPGSLRRAASLADPAVIGIAVAESLEGEGGLEAPLAGGNFATVKVDASYGAVLAGDLLTSSPTPGHAMVAIKAPPGTVIGKALEPFESGTGLIRVLVIPR